ncbi:MAG: cytidylate kinase-like family protein [Acidobacteriia bacterium]|nr:cytidylate kinase-like family protein [Terriglobia bacterium]
MISVITIDREYGSGAADIARKLAERLNWKLWDELLTSEIARMMECDCQAVEEREERRDALSHRLFKAFMRGSFEGTLNAQRVRMVDADCIREAAETVVLQAAKQGNCVIVGRGSAYYLQANSGAFHVFVYAPLHEKVERLRKMGKSEDEAYLLAETVDQDRAAYIKQYYAVDWPARPNYHLMINSALGEDASVDVILSSIAIFEKARSST